MRTLFALSAIIAGAALSGCATDKSNMALDTVGPIPTRAAPADSTSGILVVYSAYKVNADFNMEDPYRPEYSDYKIYNADGKLLRRVHNNSGTILQEPASVNLPAGNYRIIARVNGYGFLTIPVMIETRRTTVLHLEGGNAWPDKSAFNQTNAVQLPDGRIVGWKASSASNS